MSCKCVHLWGVISLLFLSLTIPSLRASDVNNGRFEIYEFNDTFDINVPTGWQYENYTNVVGHFIPRPDDFNFSESIDFWRLDANIGLYPYEGKYFLVLSTGDFVPEPPYAKVRQIITVDDGDTLIGAYFFGTCDYRYYLDYGEIKLVPVDSNLSDINIVKVSVDSVGSYSSMKGWKRFEKTFDINQAGTYYLTIDVYDDYDWIFKSYFAVDGIVLCKNASGGGDINLDCTTDFQDFAILAADWLCDCNDPNKYNDPNDNCRLDPDLTGEGFIDTNDLQVMSENWLEGTKE